jgi:RimJ/RimL family protein N-acetyltransferase
MWIETERLVLRRWRDGDAAALALLHEHPDVVALLGRLSVEDAALSIERYEHSWETLDFGRFAVEDRATERLVGRVGVMRQPDWAASDVKDEIGWVVDRARWGEGIATEAARATLADVFERVRLPGVVSFALPANIASWRVMEKCGLRWQGTASWKGNQHVWYAIGRDEWSGSR